MTGIRTLTGLGTKEFLTDLIKIKENPLEPFSVAKYHEAPFSNLFEPTIEVEAKIFPSRMELGFFLHFLFQEIDRDLLIDNGGLWNWLTIQLFDQIAPPDPTGNRKIGEFARYIYNPHYTRYYRHLVAASWDIYSKYQEKSKIFLTTPLNVTNKVTLELACHQNLISNENMVDAILALYWQSGNDGGEGLKRGTASRKAPGNLYRFVTLMNQLELTYDVFSIPSQEILELLPLEFNKWKGIKKTPLKKKKRAFFDLSHNRSV
ncbi:MAG: hypothetical protein NTV68_05185 [Methanomicrobiales archaeon]|nr:hypothetical protein [Methanomicrobiales archaeon]